MRKPHHRRNHHVNGGLLPRQVPTDELLSDPEPCVVHQHLDRSLRINQPSLDTGQLITVTEVCDDHLHLDAAHLQLVTESAKASCISCHENEVIPVRSQPAGKTLS